jgi:hypothetical protein
MALELVPVTLAEAKLFIAVVHRHNPKVVGARSCVGAAENGEMVGVALVGRPVNKHLDDGWTAEITRVANEAGYKNACSFLFNAASKLARSMGYRRCFTYNQKRESGSSLRALGWKVLYDIRGRSWNTPSRPRMDKHTIEDRQMWVAFGDISDVKAAS